MQDRFQIDQVHARAICAEIGERLRQALSKDEAELPDDEEEQAATASTAAVPATAKTARPCPARMELIMVKEFLLFSGKNAQETS